MKVLQVSKAFVPRRRRLTWVPSVDELLVLLSIDDDGIHADDIESTGEKKSTMF